MPDVPLREHLEAIMAERDRRYADVAAARERALQIKETADHEALRLAREIQTYKDEKANELRSQIESERGSYVTVALYNQRHEELEQRLANADRRLVENVGIYATKADLAPVLEYISTERGRRGGVGLSVGAIVGALTAVVAVITIVTVLANVLTS